MFFLKKIYNRIFTQVVIPSDFSQERYMTAYPDCGHNAKKHYKTQGYYEHRICYREGDMGDKKEFLPPVPNTPLISIIITSYNYERYITETLDSLLDQTYNNYEIVIIDDGSTDNSVEIINSYVNKHKNIHLYQHDGGENRGLPASVRLGIEKSKGEYIAFCESDDYWTKEHLEEKVKIINSYKDVSIISNAIKMFGYEKDIAERGWVCDHIRKLLKQGGNPIDLRYNDFNFIPTLSSVMIERSLLMSLDYNSPIPAWLDFWLYRQILINHKLYFVDREMTLWRQHNSFNGLSNSSKIANRLPEFIKKSNELIHL